MIFSPESRPQRIPATSFPGRSTIELGAIQRYGASRRRSSKSVVSERGIG
jgi:hypothetical protein